LEWSRGLTLFFVPLLLRGQLEQYTRETLVPLYPQQQGCKGALFLTDRSANKVMAITLWETEADMAAGEASEGYYREQLAKLAQWFASAPSREAYEVTAQVTL